MIVGVLVMVGVLDIVEVLVGVPGRLLALGDDVRLAVRFWVDLDAAVVADLVSEKAAAGVSLAAGVGCRVASGGSVSAPRGRAQPARISSQARQATRTQGVKN